MGDATDDDFATYASDTVDQGTLLLITTLVVSVGVNMLLPCFVNIGSRRRNRRLLAPAKVDGVERECTEKGESSIGIEEDNVPEYIHGTDDDAESEGMQMLPNKYQETMTGKKTKQRDDKSDTSSRRSRSSQNSRSSRRSASSSRSAILSAVSNFFDTEVSLERAGVRRRPHRRRRHKGLEIPLNLDIIHSEIRSDMSSTSSMHGNAKQSESNFSDAAPNSVSHMSESTGTEQIPASSASQVSEGTGSESAASQAENNCVAIKSSFTLENIDLCCGPRAWWKPVIVSGALDDLLDLAEWDNESRRIMRKALTSSVGGVLSGALDLATLSLISRYFGTQSLAAYSVAVLTQNVTAGYASGIQSAASTLSAHACGAGNYFLAGQYVQIAAILYTVALIPFSILWAFVTKELLMWVGLDDGAAQSGQDFAILLSISYIISGPHDPYVNLLYVLDKDRWATIVYALDELFTFVGVVLLVLTKESANLTDLGLIWVAVSVVVPLIDYLYTQWKGWMKPFLKGMVRSFALKNRAAVVRTVKLGIPMCNSYLISYGEWEVLTFFAAALGTTEVAAWGIIGSLWTMIEQTSNAVGYAGEICCSSHLGAGRPQAAKISSYKAIWWGVYVSCFITAIIFVLGENLVTWFTSEPTLQRMMVDLIPFIGVGNITLTAGMVSFSLVSAQSRTQFATRVQAVASWGLTMPLAAVSTYVLRLDLQGLTTAAMIGFAVGGAALTYILAMSDWEAISAKVAGACRHDDDKDAASTQESSNPSPSTESSDARSTSLESNDQQIPSQD